jgi:hypothetical protein
MATSNLAMWNAITEAINQKGSMAALTSRKAAASIRFLDL